MNPTTVQAPSFGVPTTLLQGNWEQAWRDVLHTVSSRGIHRLHLTDFDGTKYDDILVRTNEAIGPCDPISGAKLWTMYDRAFKDPQGALIDPTSTTLPKRSSIKGDRMFMTNGAHLEAEYRDLFDVMRKLHPQDEPLAKLAEWICANVGLIEGAVKFVDDLDSLGIATLGITNGAWQIAERLLAHHGMNIPFMGNYFEGEEFKCVHGEDVGVDKARLVEIAHESGFEIVSCAGDSKGDIGLCSATAKLGGLVIVRGSEGGLEKWAMEHLNFNQWLMVESYGKEVLAAVQQRIAG